MQKMYRYLANNKVVVLANLAGYVTEYRPVYQKNLQVYRGIDNVVHFEVRNHDQKPINLSGYTPKIMVFTENNVLVLEKEGNVLDDAITRTTSAVETAPDKTLTFSSTSNITAGMFVSGTYIKNNTLVTDVTDNTVTMNKSATGAVPTGTEITFQTKSKKGVFTITLTENELLDLKQQYLKYAIYLVNSTGEKVLTYSSDHFEAKGTMYLDGMTFPGPLASYNLQSFTADNDVWYTESIDAQPGINGNSALHTAAFYTDTFSGDIVVEGTLENLVTLDTNWAEVATLTLTGSESEPTPLNFNGVFTFLRFKTATDPTDKISKILIRN